MARGRASGCASVIDRSRRNEARIATLRRPAPRSARFSVRTSPISRQNEQSARTSHLNAGLVLRSCDPFARDRCFGVVARAQQVGSVPCVRRHLCVVARERAKMPLRGPSGTFAPLEWGRRARRIAPLRLSGRPLACAYTTPHVPRHPSGARMLPMWKQNRSRVRAVYYSITPPEPYGETWPAIAVKFCPEAHDGQKASFASCLFEPRRWCAG